ncbi:GNAT family N-acetyltransferase [Priestia megaterium]|uniref:GNAT family N-acetyltransferase n=1 Tax=Priestia TaxID=2800373 RepID=UPI0005C790CF|nr:GNAT family N-acetyltransferase [Priestia megaterium]
MISFEPITADTMYIVSEIINSNEAYNVLENGKKERSEEELFKEYMNEKTDSYFIKADDTYVGVIDYMKQNPNDDYPWIGAFIIHSAYHNFSFGTQAYLAFEDKLKEEGVSVLRLGVLSQNPRAKLFWERLGFTQYATKPLHHNQVNCLEKEL